MNVYSLFIVVTFLFRIKSLIKTAPKLPKKKYTRKKCSEPGCTKQSITQGKCRKHGSPAKKCKENGCDKNVYANGCCWVHGNKKDSMICKIENCNTHSVKGGLCWKHHGNMKKRTCSVDGCTNLVQNNNLCFAHGATRHICTVDGCQNKIQIGGLCCAHGAIASYKCKIIGCDRTRCKGGFCDKHGGVKPKCVFDGCETNAMSNNLCITHGGGTRCKYEGCIGSFARYKNPDDGKHYCLDCLLKVKPDDSRLKTCVRKEVYVLAELERKLPWLQETAIKIQWDLGVDGSCLGKRPDLLCDFGSYVLILEIDEDQHLRNCLSSEKQKMNQIWEQLGNKPIGFLRFNPDAYTDDEGIKHPSAFVTYRVNTGEKRVRAAYSDEFEERMDCLAQTVEHMVTNELEGVQFLYYDTTNTYEADSPDEPAQTKQTTNKIKAILAMPLSLKNPEN